ncbi:hypothetical protein HJC10_41030 [Corallococcus exiguus]|uniref:Uncharacterized protein n=1 Tax=Corallococcus exiguus TaxID=83462 RepID=A0A7X4YIX3_9BACT|nr:MULTISPECIES: hypothetical protein [Corallococcus]NBC45252.1 hypothetical protein [Corallococcus exiguus]NNB91675.1 hypothetical protein [Corallococcus exiguus]NNB99783.1 hypothetical protein [Corallococcus exiguus]NNC09191.1 hypothetical protein [Corallococcus exiguus]NPC53489.1 hypothetical protein [Corallococcus exiguus]
MAYYFHVLALCVGAALCLVLGRALFEPDEPAPVPVTTQTDPSAPRVVRMDAGNHPRK